MSQCFKTFWRIEYTSINEYEWRIYKPKWLEIYIIPLLRVKSLAPRASDIVLAWQTAWRRRRHVSCVDRISSSGRGIPDAPEDVQVATSHSRIARASSRSRNSSAFLQIP